MNKVLVFIGSPYSKPSVSHNVNSAAMEFDWLIKNLGDRIIPMSMVVFSAYQDMIVPREYEEWLGYCIDVMRKCDIYYAMPGESSGMDREIAVCNVVGIPVVRSRDELIEYLENNPEILDSDIAKIRRELSVQLYEAKRKGLDLARVKADQFRNITGAVLSDGAKFIGKQVMDIAVGSGRKKTENEDR